MLAIRSIDMTSPMLRPGLQLKMDGLSSAYIVQGGLFQRWDAANQTNVNQGNVIDLDGKEKNCSWDLSVSASGGRPAGGGRCHQGPSRLAGGLERGDLGKVPSALLH